MKNFDFDRFYRSHCRFDQKITITHRLTNKSNLQPVDLYYHSANKKMGYPFKTGQTREWGAGF